MRCVILIVVSLYFIFNLYSLSSSLHLADAARQLSADSGQTCAQVRGEND
jgi:hypothetical protein